MADGESSLQIVFDGNVDVFSQADVIKGKLILTVGADGDKEVTDIKDIRVRFTGKAKTQWASRDSSERRYIQKQKERYLDITLILFETEDHERDLGNLSLASGSHSFPFEFQFSRWPLLPPSFEGAYGHVRYKAKATVSFEGASAKNSGKTFTVTGPTVDLNLIPGAEAPVKANTEVRFCGCSGHVETIISIGLPRQGYVPGESIYVVGSVDNYDGNEGTRCFVAELVQKVFFRCNRERKTKMYTLLRAETPVACPMDREMGFTVTLQPIPPVPPSGLPGCNLMDVEYYVKCEESSLNDEMFPVTIGTVPFQTGPPGTSGVPSAPSADTSGESTRLLTASAPDYNVFEPPPSYKESLGS